MLHATSPRERQGFGGGRARHWLRPPSSIKLALLQGHASASACGAFPDNWLYMCAHCGVLRHVSVYGWAVPMVPMCVCVCVPQGCLVHEGSAVTAGAKYVIRSDVLYKLDPKGRAPAPQAAVQLPAVSAAPGAAQV